MIVVHLIFSINSVVYPLDLRSLTWCWHLDIFQCRASGVTTREKIVSFLEEQDIYYVFTSKSVSSRVCVLMAAQVAIRTF